jgi:hypothetical protein
MVTMVAHRLFELIRIDLTPAVLSKDTMWLG